MTEIATTRARPHRTRQLALRPGLTPEQAMRRVTAACLKQFAAGSAAAIKTDDAECVHRTRVALRRLRSALRFFDGTSADSVRRDLDRALRRLTRTLGAQRDWEVFATALMPKLCLPPGSVAQVYSRIDSSRRKTRARLASPETAVLIASLGAWLAAADGGSANGSLTGYFSGRLEQLHRRALADTESFDAQSENQRHHVRIRVKRLRYAVDDTGALYAQASTARYTAALKALQKILGDLTDINMARIILGKLELEKAERKAARAVLRMRKASHLKRVRAAFERVAAAGGFWQQNRKGVGHV